MHPPPSIIDYIKESALTHADYHRRTLTSRSISSN